jgi:glycosyltransferase involved in cell wall biosynthesis
METPIKINFVGQGGASFASYRLRVMKPCTLLNKYTDNLDVSIFPKALADVDVNIFSKHFDMNSNIMAARHADDYGYYTIFDICDDHFDRVEKEEYHNVGLSKYYKEMCSLADLITCNSKPMAERIKEVTGRTAIPIDDPFTFPEKPFKPYLETAKPRITCFGHITNVQPLFPWLDNLDDSYKVRAITNGGIAHPKVDFIPWSPMRVENELATTDIVFIPTTKHPWTKYKSPNRVLDSLISGCFVVTDDEELYGDFKDFIYIIDKPEDIMEAINYWRSYPKEVEEKVKKGQKFVKKRYSEDIVLDGWLKAFRELGIIKQFKKVGTDNEA